MWRLSLLILAFVLLSAGRAFAYPEHCPAIAVRYNVYGSTNAGLMSLALGAQTKRSVSGEVIAHTNSGWYSFAFPPTQIASKAPDYGNQYLSDPFYVQFPPAVTAVDHLWILSATATEDSRWEKLGKTVCAPAQAAPWRPALKPDLGTTPAATAATIKATPADPPSKAAAACTTPDRQASMAEPVTPTYPESAAALNLGASSCSHTFR